jgi:hypothetical protein
MTGIKIKHLTKKHSEGDFKLKIAESNTISLMTLVGLYQFLTTNTILT